MNVAVFCLALLGTVHSLCTDNDMVCIWTNDAACDDGGPGSMYSACPIGTDCTDCGPRIEPPPAPPNPPQPPGFPASFAVCDDTCIWPKDDGCDDGGAGSEYSGCDQGTDCTDCGPRFLPPPPSPSPPPPFAPPESPPLSEPVTPPSPPTPPTYPAACLETCSFSGDDDCDDGGPGSEWTSCSLGTDCAPSPAHTPCTTHQPSSQIF